MGIGDYPDEYNPKVHGIYDPGRYYGKPDIPFGQVKLNELGGWLVRRRKTPSAFIAACSRAHWRWMHKFMFPKRSGASAYLQIGFCTMVLFYILNYKRISFSLVREFH